MIELINDIACFSSAADEDGTWLNNIGFLSGHMGAVSVVLIVLGLLILYFGVKLMKGYSFHVDETVVVEKDEGFAEMNADIAERRATEIPNYANSANGKGNDLFKEMRIVYTVDGTEYSQWVSDLGEDMYKDSVPIKYDPQDPNNFYIFSGDDDFEGIPDENGELDGNEDDETSDSSSKGVGVVIIIIGVLFAVLGTGFLIDHLTR